MLNKVHEAAGGEFGPPAVQCESQVPPGLLEEDGLARFGADDEKLGMLITGEFGGNHFGDVVYFAGHLPVLSSRLRLFFATRPSTSLGFWVLISDPQAASRALRRGTWPLYDSRC